MFTTKDTLFIGGLSLFALVSVLSLLILSALSERQTSVVDVQSSVIRQLTDSLDSQQRKLNDVQLKYEILQHERQDISCVWAQSRTRDLSGREIVLGDVPLCGTDLHWGNVAGPTKQKLHDQLKKPNFSADGYPIPEFEPQQDRAMR